MKRNKKKNDQNKPKLYPSYSWMVFLLRFKIECEIKRIKDLKINQEFDQSLWIKVC